MKRHLVTLSSDTVVFLRQGAQHPRDDEWDDTLAQLRSKKLDQVRVLVMTAGGSPTPSQQARLAKVLSGRAVPVAVVSESALVRFVVSSVALITKRIRSFSTADLASAYAHLQLNTREREFVDEAIRDSLKLMQGE